MAAGYHGNHAGCVWYVNMIMTPSMSVADAAWPRLPGNDTLQLHCREVWCARGLVVQSFSENIHERVGCPCRVLHACPAYQSHHPRTILRIVWRRMCPAVDCLRTDISPGKRVRSKVSRTELVLFFESG